MPAVVPTGATNTPVPTSTEVLCALAIRVNATATLPCIARFGHEGPHAVDSDALAALTPAAPVVV